MFCIYILVPMSTVLLVNMSITIIVIIIPNDFVIRFDFLVFLLSTQFGAGFLGLKYDRE